MLPDRQTFEEALAMVRMPRPTIVNGTVSGIDLHIGSADVDPDQAIRIPVKYSKATMKARPPSLSKAWKAAVDLQGPQPGSGGYRDTGASQLMASVTEQSQDPNGRLEPSDIAAMISAEVKQHSTYVVKKQAPEPATQATQASQAQPSQMDPDFVAPDEPMPDVCEEEAEEEYVAKEDIVKAWRFGSTWVPMEVDMFEPLITNKGVEILNFIPTEHASVTMPLPDVVADQNRSSVITS
jgi:ATP-dependent DNA helicase 2 subunit 2